MLPIECYSEVEKIKLECLKIKKRLILKDHKDSFKSKKLNFFLVSLRACNLKSGPKWQGQGRNKVGYV